MLIVKSIKPVLFIIDEYSYFLLFTQKNPYTTLVYQFCFDSTWKRWEPDYIASIPVLHRPRFDSLNTNDYNRTPTALRNQSEHLIFISNTEHYWRTYVPLTIVTHFVLMVL